MNKEDVVQYTLSKPDAYEDFPFGPDVAVYKVRDKMFAAVGKHEGVYRINLKCEPLEALMLRDLFAGVIPGYHMNKKHWNTVILDGTVPKQEVKRMIDNSYSLVFKSLPKKVQNQLKLEYNDILLPHDKCE
ncbi:MmcQ/YjbR family DNA-binding protein [Pleionea sediminis]|uniref:MmcQ/YjbR family DNA-binding protein n=1 Tax=Pleionea sediminis TaxID=2569479 RepID=UPI001185005F|nr:MmcQ/YjbR family DNA-binding protein [Pleionea sediminis]